MNYNPDIHHRRSIRLKGYDYSRAGAYFVTLCVQNRECLFGDIVNGKLKVNNAGTMIWKIWNDLSVQYPNTETDEFIVMPNHVHGIILLSVGAGPRACPPFGPARPVSAPYVCPDKNRSNTKGQRLIEEGQPQGVAPTGLSLPDLVHRFKSFTTSLYRAHVLKNNWPSFPGRLRQRNYYEHIIRNEEELNWIREYISTNPARWAEDENNPVANQLSPL